MKEIKELSPKRWGMMAITSICTLVLGMGLLTYVVDPYFHFHAPIEGMRYRLYEQRYINDGISRHFEYDTLVIGNSLSENVKTSQVDELFGCKSIKLPYSGASYKELWESIDRAISYNPKLKDVFVFFDAEDAMKDKDYVRYPDCPDYLYDDNLLNDAAYLWNKDIFYRGTIYNLLMTVTGRDSTTFDEYSARNTKTGASVVLPQVGELPDSEDAWEIDYTDEMQQMVRDNMNANIIEVVENYPGVRFHFIYSPPSIARWAKYHSWHDMQCRIESQRTATKMLLQHSNVELYTFQDEFDLVCNLDNYQDTVHYSAEICEYMMESVSQGKNRLSSDNMDSYFEMIEAFYQGYDYLSLRYED